MSTLNHIMNILGWRMSTRHQVKTGAEVRTEFSRKGQTFKAWAREHGYPQGLVYEVLRGRPCLHGKSHEIAVMLGMKDGVIERHTHHKDAA